MINKKLKQAIHKLETLESVTVKKAITSHYAYGTLEPFLNDRFDICLHVTDKDDIYCQVVLNNVDYSDPPDIIFNKKQSSNKLIAHMDNLHELLPAIDWDLNNEDCFYNWFTDILSKKQLWFVIDDNSKDIWNISDDEIPTKKKVDNLKRKEESVKTFPIFNKSKKRATNSDDDNMDDFEVTVKPKKIKIDTVDTKAFKREFVLTWIYYYKDHIIQYDAENFKSLTLYLTFDIDKNLPIWEEYYQEKMKKLAKFKSTSSNKNKIPNPKPLAPIMVHFEMENEFPKSKLKIKLISAINTVSSQSSEPSYVDLEYVVDVTKNIPDLIHNIKNYINEISIKFHLLQTL